MQNAIRVIAGDMKNIYHTTFLNALHLMLKGAPFGILFLVIRELFLPPVPGRIIRLTVLCAGIAVIMAVNLWLGIQVHVKAFTTSYDLSTKARLRLGNHLRKLSLGFFKKRDPGDISSLLLQDMAKVEMIFSHFFMDAVACIVLPLMMGAFFMVADRRMAMVMAVSVLLAVPAFGIAQKIIGYFGKRHMATAQKTASRMLEYLQGIKVLMAFNQTGSKFSRLDRAMQQFCRDSIKLEAAAGGPILIYSIILDLGFVGLLLLGTYLWLHGQLAVPVFILFLTIGYKFFEPLVNFGVFFSEMRYMNIAARRISTVMDTPPFKEPDTPLDPQTHDIAFCDVDFGYTPSRKVLDHFSARFPGKSITALVGASGSGKTTITSLIARFWDVDGGRVMIGGVDVRDIPTERLNAMISIVFQDVYLFQDTVFNNIRVGKKDAGRDEVTAAAKAAHCHEFIEGLEHGYDTMVGEGGATLSGGEKQRISIARALLKDAPIVLLDEATASLDPENELLIQKAIANMVENKTLIVIAHRLRTIAGADRILVLDDGCIAEQGVHAQLLTDGGQYSRLWNEQQKAGGWKFGVRPAVS